MSCAVPNRPEGAPKLTGGMKITVRPDTLAFRIYRQPEVREEFTCNYELNPDFQPAFEAGGLCLSGLGERGEVRMVELPTHPFFLATLFQPQLAARPERPHPLITAYLQAALESRAASGER